MSQPAESARSAGGEQPSREHLGIAGSGTIACGLAACAAICGVRVTLWGRSEESLERAGASLDDEGANAGDVALTGDLESLAAATVLVEAVAEDEYVKHEVLRSLAATARDEALLATTTSSLSIASLAAATESPERFFGLHVFNPVTKMKLVELCFPAAAPAVVRERAA